MTDHRPKAPRDQQAVDAVRAHLRSIGAGETDDSATDNVAQLTREERGQRLARRAQARTLGRTGGDAA